jgi:hypothetical protein
MAHHVFPYLVGILFSTGWTFVLGMIEIFDSDMAIAGGYFAFAGLSSILTPPLPPPRKFLSLNFSLANLLVDLRCFPLP